MDAKDKRHVAALVAEAMEEHNRLSDTEGNAPPIGIYCAADTPDEVIAAALEELATHGIEAEITRHYATTTEALPAEWAGLPRFMLCEALPVDCDDACMIFHTRYPRFFLHTMRAEATEPLWIDSPDPSVNVEALVNEAFAEFQKYLETTPPSLGDIPELGDMPDLEKSGLEESEHKALATVMKRFGKQVKDIERIALDRELRDTDVNLVIRMAIFTYGEMMRWQTKGI